MKSLNLDMLIERRAQAREHRIVPETVARFMREAAPYVPFTLKPVASLSHTYDPALTPQVLRHYETASDWRCQPLANRYPRISTDRETAEKQSLEWVTPGHPLFEALRRHMLTRAHEAFLTGASFYSLEHPVPARIDFYRAKVVDGLGHIAHERLFAVELREGGAPQLRDPNVLGNLTPAPASSTLPSLAHMPEALMLLHEHVLTPFLEKVRAERTGEVERVKAHIELSLTELLEKEDRLIGRFAEEAERGGEGAAGLLAQAEDRHAKLFARRERRRQELERQKSLSLQGVERITSVLVFSHPDRNAPDIRNLHPDPRTEATAMQVVIAYEQSLGRTVTDIHEKDLGYDITSLDPQSGDLRLIEIKGIGAETGTVCLTPNEKRVAEDRRDCYWLYVVTHCNSTPQLQPPVKDPAGLPWHEVKKVDHYYLSVNAMTQPMAVSEKSLPYQRRGEPAEKG